MKNQWQVTYPHLVVESVQETAEEKLKRLLVEATPIAKHPGHGIDDRIDTAQAIEFALL
jgi:hypothetical protein